MIVTTKHLFTIPGFSKRPGFCRTGAKLWFRDHALEWREFVRAGIEEQKLLDTNDALAVALVNWARKCETQGSNNG